MEQYDNLVFKKTLTPNQFKTEFNLDRVDILLNPKTGLKFFSATGFGTGRVSHKNIEKPVFSLCNDTDSGEEFWMLHNEGSGGAEVLMSL